MILAGDLGGTKTLLAICEVAGESVHVQREASFASGDHGCLEDIVEKFLRELAPELRAIDAACFGVAGPVSGSTATITNLPWTVDATSLSRLLGGADVSLMNDLQAAALGLLTLPASSFVGLQTPAAPPAAGGTVAVLAPGTGFGQALLVHLAGEYHALSMEAGHADFAATTDEEYELATFLRQRYGQHVSYEHVLCGAGLSNVYDFVRARSKQPEPAWLSAALASPQQRNAMISTTALEGKDPCCVRALELFVEILGNEAGNAALRGLARGGVILGGGIPPKILPALKRTSFLTRFRNKGHFAAWMESLEVRVSLEPRAGLLGAAHRARSAQKA